MELRLRTCVCVCSLALAQRYAHERETPSTSLSALKNMLREEIGNGPDTKAPGAAGDGSGAYSPGDYESDIRAKQFLSSGRSGRRNALGGFRVDDHVETGALDLPNRFEKLTVETG